MKALVKEREAPGLSFMDVPEPGHARQEVLVRVKRAGICGTDLHIFDWDVWAQRTIPLGLTIGHEFVGEVVDVGADVSDVEIGDIVGAEGHLVCGRCRNCKAGRRHLCVASRGIGVHRPGAFAEFVALPAANPWRHRPDIDLDVAAIFDPLGNAVHTALEFPVLGEDVLICGCGPIGLMATAVARHAGARSILVTDLHPRRRELGLRMGADCAIDPRETTIARAAAGLGVSEGFAVGMEMSGSPEALAALLTAMASGGQVAVLGIPAAPGVVDWHEVVFKMLTIKGIYGRRIFETWRSMSVMLESGVDVSPVITDRFAAADYSEAFERARAGEAGKVILDWEAL